MDELDRILDKLAEDKHITHMQRLVLDMALNVAAGHKDDIKIRYGTNGLEIWREHVEKGE